MEIQSDLLALFALVCIIAMVCMSLYVIIIMMAKLKFLIIRERIFNVIATVILSIVNFAIIRWYVRTLLDFLILK